MNTAYPASPLPPRERGAKLSQAGVRPSHTPLNFDLSLCEGVEKGANFRLVNQSLLEMVLGVKYGIGFVTVLIQPGPGHLLLPPPRHAHRSTGAVPGDVDIVTAP